MSKQRGVTKQAKIVMMREGSEEPDPNGNRAQRRASRKLQPKQRNNEVSVSVRGSEESFVEDVTIIRAEVKVNGVIYTEEERVPRKLLTELGVIEDVKANLFTRIEARISTVERETHG